MDKFIKRLNQLMNEQKINYRQLSKAVNIPYLTILKFLNKESIPRTSHIIKLADYFKCSVDFLLGRTNLND